MAESETEDGLSGGIRRFNCLPVLGNSPTTSTWPDGGVPDRSALSTTYGGYGSVQYFYAYLPWSCNRIFHHT